MYKTKTICLTKETEKMLIAQAKGMSLSQSALIRFLLIQNNKAQLKGGFSSDG